LLITKVVTHVIQKSIINTNVPESEGIIKVMTAQYFVTNLPDAENAFQWKTSFQL